MILMTFGSDKTTFKSFNEEYNNGIVNLSGFGFAEEWAELVDYDKSKAQIKDGKLIVEVHGIPNHINEESVKKYFAESLEQGLRDEYAELVEGDEGCPLLIIAEHEGKEVFV